MPTELDSEVKNLIFVSFVALLVGWAFSLFERIVRIRSAEIKIGRDKFIVKDVAEVRLSSFRKIVEEKEMSKDDPVLIPSLIHPFLAPRTTSEGCAKSYFTISEDERNCPTFVAKFQCAEVRGYTYEGRLLCVVDEEDILVHAASYGASAKASAPLPTSPTIDFVATESGKFSAAASRAERRTFSNISSQSDNEFGSSFLDTAHGLVTKTTHQYLEGGVTQVTFTTPLWNELIQHIDDCTADYPIVLSVLANEVRSPNVEVVPASVLSHRSSASRPSRDGRGDPPTTPNPHRIVYYYVGEIVGLPEALAATQSSGSGKFKQSTPIPVATARSHEAISPSSSMIARRNQGLPVSPTHPRQTFPIPAATAADSADGAGSSMKKSDSMEIELHQINQLISMSIDTQQEEKDWKSEAEPSSKISTWLDQRRQSIVPPAPFPRSERSEGDDSGKDNGNAVPTPQTLAVLLRLKYIAIDGKLRVLRDVFLPEELTSAPAAGSSPQENSVLWTAPSSPLVFIASHSREFTRDRSEVTPPGAGLGAPPSARQRASSVTSLYLPRPISPLSERLAHVTIGFDCIICCAEPAEILVLPCRHCVICRTCIRRLSNCPVCRTLIESTLVLFLEQPPAAASNRHSLDVAASTPVTS